MIDWATRDLGRPSAFIQWKGTDVCMDVWCSCGANTHIDDDFTYYVKCSGCGKVFEVSAVIELRELGQDEEPRIEPCEARK